MGTRRKLFPDIAPPVDSTYGMATYAQRNNMEILSGSNDDNNNGNGNGNDNSTSSSPPPQQRRKALTLKWIQWIESLTVPQCCVRRLPAKIRDAIITTTSNSQQQDMKSNGNNNNNNNNSSSLQQTIPVISGIERVLYGTQPAAEVVTIAGIHPPRYLCYMISGSGCDIIQLLVDFFLYYNVTQDASLCWALSFGLVVSVRHTTHRYLVFGDYVGGYWKSLGRMYGGYSIIIVLSTVFNMVMTKYIQVPHAFAWIFTMLWTGIVNYFILKKLWSFGGGNGISSAKIKTDEQELAPMITSTARSPSSNMDLA